MRYAKCNDMKNNRNFLSVTLGLLTAFAPFVTDLYLPGLPALAAYFGSSASMAQMSLTMSMLGLSAGQLLIGPLSDRYGRKIPLMVSLFAFLLTTVMCIISPSITIFNVMRFLQGAMAAGGIVIARSVATDLYTGRELTRFLTMISAVNGVAPVLAPIFGGLLLNYTSWKGAFVLLLVYGAALAIMCNWVGESLPKDKRSTSSVLSTFASFGPVLRNGRYLSFLAVYALSMLVLFSYISSSPFILQRSYGLSPLGFSLCFSLNAVAIGAGCALAAVFKNEYVTLRTGAVCMVASAVMTMFALLFHAPVWAVEICFILLMLCFGVLQPASTALTLDSERQRAGTASALLGASGFVMGGIASPLVGIGDIITATSVMILIGSLATAAAVAFSCRKYKA